MIILVAYIPKSLANLQNKSDIHKYYFIFSQLSAFCIPISGKR